MAYNYKLQHRDDLKGQPIKKFEALFSTTVNGEKIPPKDITGFFRIWCGDQSACVKGKPYNGNDVIFLNPGVIAAQENTMVNSFERISNKEFFKYKIKEDTNEKMAFYGLLIAVLGLVIDLIIGFTKIENHFAWLKANILYITMKLFSLLIFYKRGLRLRSIVMLSS
ncbi:hypothetical protein [Chitinophaga sp. LS1]|uniref:hypothetical protein n=1 Tax=Chitinophaga sp. LS1 TaxID=3051176 RepID=UPI002AAA91A3|nr:hypothetical protein [Chitinophaga sp. LS1]WPV66381.1 hypothetical protein QQL36_31800 [Chitinophaga sp. LS1]